ANTAQKASAADQRHQEFTDKLSVMRQNADTKLEAVKNAADDKSRQIALKEYQEAQKNLRSFEADYVNAQNGPNADTPEGKAEAGRLHDKADAAGAAAPPSPTGKVAPGGDDAHKVWPMPDANHIKMLKDGIGTPEQFDEVFGPGAAKNFMGK